MKSKLRKYDSKDKVSQMTSDSLEQRDLVFDEHPLRGEDY